MLAILIRTVILYVFVSIGIRLMGKRQIADLQPNELVITLLISEIAAIPLQDTNQPVINGVVAIFILVILEITVSVIAMKSPFVRRIMSGKSVVIIKNGVLDQNAMKKVRMTVMDLIELLRGQNVFDISTVAFAVLEVDGTLSVLLKSDQRPVTVKDIKLSVPQEGVCLPVISDGEIVKDSLYSLQTNAESIKAVIEKENLTVEEVFLMTLDRYGNKTIIKKGDDI